MRKILSLILLFSMLSPATILALGPSLPGTLQVEVIADDGRVFPLYALSSTRPGTQRAYLEAVNGKNYAIRVRNNSPYRRGLVIAVDGRNIISGKKSELLSSERMYILEPWQSASYRGWRTSQSSINRFFFTTSKNSYAEAWSDRSAMGVIALAAYNPKPARVVQPKVYSPGKPGPNDSAMEAEVASADSAFRKEKRQAGTGFGEQQYSHARVVAFSPQSGAAEKIFLKYEWRQTLCEKRVVDCYPEPGNRFWPQQEDSYGFVPYPPAG